MMGGVVPKGELRSGSPTAGKPPYKGLAYSCTAVLACAVIVDTVSDTPPLAELLGKPDDDALRPTNIGKPVRFLVLHLANEFCAMSLHPRKDSIHVIDGKHDATKTQSIHWRVHGPKPDCIRRMEFVEFNSLPIWSPQHREGGSDVSKPNEAPDRRPFNRGLALKLEAQLDKERLHRFEIVNNYQDVVHSLHCHVLRSLFTTVSRIWGFGVQIEPGG
jgi:hypothetical protein